MNTSNQLSKFFSIFFSIGIVMLIGVIIQLSIWTYDRESPFRVIESRSIAAKPGDNTTINAIVRRDLSRKCKVVYSRVFYDSTGTMFNLTDMPQKTSAKGIADINTRMPNELRLGFQIPSGASIGPAAVVTYLDYECNPVHKFYPISVVMSVNIEVI